MTGGGETDSRRPVLIVDDDREIIELARRVLEHRGWRVEGATDPRVGLELAMALEPCLILVDLMMPHMDGEEFLQQLRSRIPEDKQPRIALVSAAYTRAEVARRLDVDASIAKPFDIEDLTDLAARFASAERDQARASAPPPAPR